MFWKRKKTVPAVTVSPHMLIIGKAGTGKTSPEAIGRFLRERSLRDQDSWPDLPWPSETEEDRELLLCAQQSIDNRYAERWPHKTYSNLVVLRRAAEMGGIPLSQVIDYLAECSVAEAIDLLKEGMPLEYVRAMRG